MSSEVFRVSHARRWKVPAAAGAVVAGAFVAFSRLPVAAQGAIWGEDGSVFLQKALESNNVTGLFAPYAGYLHVVPRLAASLTVKLFAVDRYGIVMNFLSCLTVSLIAFLVFHCSKALTKNIYIRLAWASITIFVAPAPIEALGNFANIHWYLLWLVPWLLLKPASSKFEGITLFVAAALASLTEISSAMFLPLFLYRYKDTSFWPARFGVLVGVACQVATTLTYPRPAPEGNYPLNVWSVVEGWFLHGSSALMFGNAHQITNNIVFYGAASIVLAAIPFFGAFAGILIWGTNQQRLLACVFMLGSFVAYAAAQTVNFSKVADYVTFDKSAWTVFYLTRYATITSMLLLGLIPLLAAVLERKSPGWWRAVLGGFLVLQVVYFFPVSVIRQDGPVWQESVQAQRTACSGDAQLGSIVVPITPAFWSVELQCDRLRR
ncbi:hypothetical protein E5206_08495 [Arthrobacter sp. PAMC25564]|uniref:hypothetical protein n=1 Tax=Arthrobacter sp. PAMC25564 TaxID=2565366 RepID=UPI0010A20A26|nr:hypothetical protein [Arthrobacter sp. PAMC25564]QCB96961.1 hypothetical protein E5206_08495 [Arthrobacter sp. PAMC25564]